LDTIPLRQTMSDGHGTGQCGCGGHQPPGGETEPHTCGCRSGEGHTDDGRPEGCCGGHRER
jgi:hypothetical protein